MPKYCEENLTKVLVVENVESQCIRHSFQIKLAETPWFLDDERSRPTLLLTNVYTPSLPLTHSILYLYGQVRATCRKSVVKRHAIYCHQASCQMRSFGLLRLDDTCLHQHDDRLAASCCQHSCRKLSLTDLLQFTPTDLLQCRVQAFKVGKIWCTPMQTSNFCCFPDPNTTSVRDYQSTLCMLGFLH